MTDSVHKGRPYGGLGIMWKKSLSKKCSIVEFNDERLLGLDIEVNGQNVLFVNVYLPCDSHGNEEQFMNYLSKISSIVETLPHPWCTFLVILMPTCVQMKMAQIALSLVVNY